MPDPALFLKALLVATGTAAVLALLLGWPWRKTLPRLVAASSIVGVSTGFYLGCWWLGVPAHWPPTEDQDRLLLVLLPSVMAVEFLAAVVGRAKWLFRFLRLLLALGAARLLLHNSVYVADLAGPGTQLWTFQDTYLFLCGAGAALAFVWGTLALLIRRVPGRSVLFAVALACGCAGLTIMLSRYASGGQIGLPLGAALVGAIIASLSPPTQLDWSGPLGIGVVGLFGLLMIGRFFGELSTLNASLIFFGLLLCWLPELPPLRMLRPALRSLFRVVLVAMPILVALMLARQKFLSESRPTAPGAEQPSIEDYYDAYGK